MKLGAVSQLRDDLVTPRETVRTSSGPRGDLHMPWQFLSDGIKTWIHCQYWGGSKITHGRDSDSRMNDHTTLFDHGTHTVDGCEILHQLIGGLSDYFSGFNHPRRCRIPSIHGSFTGFTYLSFCSLVSGLLFRFSGPTGAQRLAAT